MEKKNLPIGERERITVEIDQLRLGPIVEDDGCQRLIQLMGNDELRILEDGVFIIGAGLYDYGPECTPHLKWSYFEDMALICGPD
ncbi:hypothetical protein BLOT_013281 [Blomia tropicalis]|nr:hypothetical protein BLOT_013281 [Blomia tropicalis]